MRRTGRQQARLQRIVCQLHGCLYWSLAVDLLYFTPDVLGHPRAVGDPAQS